MLNMASISQFLRRRDPGWQRVNDPDIAGQEQQGQRLFRIGRVRMRMGDLDDALSVFDQALSILPNYPDAIAARAETLDMLGKSEAARPEYERARRLRAQQRSGAPDRSYVFRQCGRFTFEVDSYELALERIKTGAFPHLACGNTLLAQGRAAEALQCFDRALKIKQNEPNLMAMRGEALAMMGRYTNAIKSFDLALALNPNAPETLNARAIAHSALGSMDDANADWRRQLELLRAEQCGARACVALRLADYTLAAAEIERTLAKTPNDLYWQLYRLTVLRRMGRPISEVDVPPSSVWPAPLFALHLGKMTVEEASRLADTGCRRAETAFQLAAIAADKDEAAARKQWGVVVNCGMPALLEYGAARNELSRLGL